MAASLRAAERDCGFADFDVFRMRVLDGRSGRAVSESLGISEATVSRRLTSVRRRIQERLYEVFSKYSFTDEEWKELARNGLELNPNKTEDASFDDAVAEIYHRFAHAGAGGDTGDFGTSIQPL